jgi:hypothetical protein
MSIDYRDLLKRYIHHVGGSEGIDFLGEMWIRRDGDAMVKVFDLPQRNWRS